MTSIDQAFIKAFARRSRRPAKQSNSPASQSTPGGQLQVDPSVAETAKVWVDPIEDRLLRADTSVDHAVPEPHHQGVSTTTNRNITPAEHFRSEFVFGTVTEAEPAEPVADEPAVLETTEQADATAELVATTEPASPEVVPTTAATESTSQPVAIEAAWEVDAFELPTAVEELFLAEDFFHNVANRMRDAVNDGMKSLIVTSAQSGEGRSTVAIGIALASGAAGLRVALVDGDTEDPTLLEDLRLELEYGWVDTIRGGLPINQIAVHSIEDQVTLIPLMPPQGKSAGATAAEVEQLIESLTDQFDLVIVDGPSCAMPRIHQFSSLVDTAVIARDASRTDCDTINELSYRLRESGVKGVGIVENFS